MIRWAAHALLPMCVWFSLDQAASGQPRFRSGTDAVLVDVQVTAGGKPVVGLTADDFELKDSGVVQQVNVVSFDDVPVNLLLALDMSSSVAGERLERLKGAARAAIQALGPDDQAAVLAFTGRVTRRTGWTADRATLEAEIGELRAEGRTALHDAIFAALSFRETAEGRVIVLVFSDGDDTASWLDPNAVLQAARRSDIVVTAALAAPRLRVTGGRDARRAFGLDAALRRWFESDPTLFPYSFFEVLTADTGGEFLHVETTTRLADSFRRIVAGFKTRYLLTYTPRNVVAGGWHPIDVRLTRTRADVRARRGYWR